MVGTQTASTQVVGGLHDAKLFASIVGENVVPVGLFAESAEARHVYGIRSRLSRRFDPFNLLFDNQSFSIGQGTVEGRVRAVIRACRYGRGSSDWHRVVIRLLHWSRRILGSNIARVVRRRSVCRIELLLLLLLLLQFLWREELRGNINIALVHFSVEATVSVCRLWPLAGYSCTYAFLFSAKLTVLTLLHKLVCVAVHQAYYF